MTDRLWFNFYQFPAQGRQHLQGFEGCVAVVFLFAFWKFVVGNETRVLFKLVVAFRTVGPSLFKAGSRPHFVHEAAVVEVERKKKADAEEKIKILKEQIANLGK